jgi:photosystem II stability/assembly factor-like uncharacterized protein
MAASNHLREAFVSAVEPNRTRAHVVDDNDPRTTRAQRLWMIDRLLVGAIIIGLVLLVVLIKQQWYPPSTTWSRLNVGEAAVDSVVADPKQPHRLYASGFGSDPNQGATNLLISDDNGVTWKLGKAGSDAAAITDLEVDPSRTGTLFASTTNKGVLKSTDGGATWLGPNSTRAVLVGMVHKLAINPAQPDIMYAASDTGVFKSEDGSRTWRLSTFDLPCNSFYTIALSRAPNTVVYAGSSCGIFKSADQGATWKALQHVPDGVESILTHPQLPGRVYLRTESSGLWLSVDVGESWQPLHVGDNLTSVTIDPSDPNSLFVSGMFGLPFWQRSDVRWSHDGGAHWSKLGSPAPNMRLENLTVVGNVLFATTQGTLWSYALPTMAVAQAQETRQENVLTRLVPIETLTDERFVGQGSYRIDRDTFWNYFNRRGGLGTFGYATSRTFLLMGLPTQLFERSALQEFPDGTVHVLNLLDTGLLPYQHFDATVFPSQDPALINQAPTVGSAGYASTSSAFVRQHAPDTWNSLPVNFFHTYLSTVPISSAYPTGGDAGLALALNLEVWGLPTSQPMYNPSNHRLVYLRFQRGIMRYDANCNCTQGLLVAPYLKAVLSGQDLPVDLKAEAAESPLLNQYDPNAPGWVHNATRLPHTDLTRAFVPERPGIGERFGAMTKQGAQ